MRSAKPPDGASGLRADAAAPMAAAAAESSAAEEEVELDNAQYSSAHAIFGVALPAIVLNISQPLCMIAQVALLGRFSGTVAVAAHGAATICASSVCRPFNFLVDGVAAKAGASVSLRVSSAASLVVQSKQKTS
jgi:Na+-driven multidrug efflux pump